MSKTEHWNRVYATRPSDRVGWFKPHLTTSLAWIKQLELDPCDAIIDVGGGASTLVDDLLAAGHRNVSVLDISERAIEVSRERLGSAADQVKWVIGDVTEAGIPDGSYGLWHDRAVFHFLTRPEERESYREKIFESLRPGGFIVIGVFSPQAPPQCSGLPVQRYSAKNLADFFGKGMKLEKHVYEDHETPSGVRQNYVYCLFRRVRLTDCGMLDHSWKRNIC